MQMTTSPTSLSMTLLAQTDLSALLCLRRRRPPALSAAAAAPPPPPQTPFEPYNSPA